MEQIRGHIDLLLLAIVSSEPMHAYAIIQRVRMLSDGVLELGDGLVYPVLHKLEGAGLVRSGWSQVGGRHRRVYGITRQGRAELARRHAAWRRITQAVGAVLEATT